MASGVQKIGELELSWELPNDWITDDYLPEEISAQELLEQWLKWLWATKSFSEELGAPHIPIRWMVRGRDSATAEAAPPVTPQDQRPNFTTYYTTPERENNDEPVNWLRLPVTDKLWRAGRADKGGFIQEATGFKPAALAPTFDLRVLAAAGIDWNDPSG